MRTITRLLRALAGLVGLMALVAGLPICLALWGSSPLRGEMSLDAVREVFIDPTDRVVVGLLTVVAWVVWALFLRALAVEVAEARRDRAGASMDPAHRGPLRLLARAMVVSLTMTVSASAGAGASSAPALGILLAPPPAVAAAVPEDPPAAPERQPDAPTPASEVEAGETLITLTGPSTAWDLAAEHLGDGMQWRTVWERNRDRVQPDGRSWTDPDATLPAGWEIVVPSGASTVSTPAAPPAGAPDTSREAATPTPAPTPPEVSVAPGDNFWEIAERTLTGDLGRAPTEAETRDYWLRLVDANRDRLAPPGDPDLIYPGQVMLTPAPTVSAPRTTQEAGPPSPPASSDVAGHEQTADVAPTPAPASESAVAAEAPQRDVEDGEPSDADGPVGPPAAEAERADAPARDRTASGQANSPVEEEIPTSPESDSAPATPQTTAPPTTTPAATTETTSHPVEVDSSPAADAGDADEDEASAVPGLVLGAAGTVLAVALLRNLRRRRRLRAARLPLAVVPPPPPRSSRPVAEEILVADEARVDRLDAALSHLAANVRARGGEPCIQPTIVQVRGSRVEVLLDRPDPAPPRPWRPEASGRIWVMDSSEDLGTDDAAMPLPTLVTIGTDEDADTLLNLEAFGVVTLTGDPEACRGMARSMVTELVARSEGTVGVDIVGDLDPQLGELDGVAVIETWDDVDSDVIAESVAVLDAHRWPHTFAARAAGHLLDSLAPTVWVTPPTAHRQFVDAATTASSRPGSGAAIVVVAGDNPAATAGGIRINLEPDGSYHIPELDLRGRAQTLAGSSVRMAADLLDDAVHTAVAETFDFPDIERGERAEPEVSIELPLDWDPTAAAPPGQHDPHAPTTATLAAAPDRYEDPEWDVLVRVCGEIHVEGGKRPLPSRETAATVFVALQDGEVDISRLRDAVWGDTTVSHKRVLNVVSAMFRSLGPALHRTPSGRLVADERLRTDLELIRRRLDYSRHQRDPMARAETLRGALEWVTGPVCTYPASAKRAWAWMDLDNWIPAAESVVGTVAQELATLYLALGDADGATWAASRGLAATGPREQLTVLLVRGYELAGDAPSAAAALQTYEAQMEELGGVEHSDEMLELLQRHLPPRRRRAAS